MVADEVSKALLKSGRRSKEKEGKNQDEHQQIASELDHPVDYLQLVDRLADVFLRNEHVNPATPTLMDVGGCTAGASGSANANFSRSAENMPCSGSDF